MATGNSGSFSISGSQNMTAVVYWSETYNESANTHVVSITRIMLKSSNWYGFTYYLNGSASINGSTVITFNSALGTHNCTVQTQNDEYQVVAAGGYENSPWSSGTISGEADGSKSVSIAINFTGFTLDGRGANGFTCSGSRSVALHTIPRKSSCSMPATTMGSAGTITITRASSSFTHTLAYSFGNASGTIVTKTSNTSVSWTPPLTLANQIPNSTSGTCTLTCYTYNGNTLIGTSTSTVNLSVPASVKPTIGAFVVSRVDGTVPSAWGIYVQSKSKAVAAISNAAGSYGSAITAFSISGGGYSSTTDSLETGFLMTAGTVTFTAKVKDSRGRWSDESTVSITIVAYSTPYVQSRSAQRCLSDGTVSTNGTYAKAKVTFTYASCSGKNSVTTATYYKKTTDSSYTNVGAAFSSGVEYILGGGNLSTDYSYDIKFVLTDAFGSYYVLETISTASVVMDFKAGGLGVAVGKVSETDNCFEVSEDWSVKVYGLLLAEYIRRNARGVFFATCDSAEDAEEKVATVSGTFVLTTGTFLAVKFTNANTVSMPKLNVNGTGVKYIVQYKNFIPSPNIWRPNQTVLFVYDGSYYVGVNLMQATTSYYGVTKLVNSVTSTATDLAAAAAAVKTAYDRNSWDSISLTNALAIAYGGTGATSAAGARSNLGITVTQLFSGTVTTGSTTFSYGNYNFYIIIGQPASSGSRTPIIVPKSALTTGAVAYQITDESYYYSFNLSYSGSTVTLAYKGRNSSGQIIAVYGVN